MVHNDRRSDAAIRSTIMTVAPSPPSDAAFGEPVAVSVRIPFSEVTWLPSPMYFGRANLSLIGGVQSQGVL
jgi:hypothetical protein